MLKTREQIQIIERRSIPLYTPYEGPRSLPVKLDKSSFAKTSNERKELKEIQNNFKNNGGLEAWNNRNRPGNNK